MRILTLVAGLALWASVAFGPALVAQTSRQPQGEIVSGSDLGFRVEGTDIRTGKPIGTWMIRVKGQWLEIGEASGIRPAK